jgi:sulfonate dioxygenase
LCDRYPPWTPFEHYEHGKDADPSFKDLLPADKAQVTEITPYIGSEVRGVQLSQLTDAGKDQLALFVAHRKVVGMLHTPISTAEKKGKLTNLLCSIP